MKPYNLQLKNVETDRVIGQCFFYLLDSNSHTTETIKEIFLDKSNEFDWSNDMSFLNCYDILYSTLLEIKEEIPESFSEIKFFGNIPNIYLYNKLKLSEHLPKDETLTVITFVEDVKIVGQKKIEIYISNPEEQI